MREKYKKWIDEPRSLTPPSMKAKNCCISTNVLEVRNNDSAPDVNEYWDFVQKRKGT